MIRPMRDYIVVKPIPREQSKVLVVISDEKYNLGLVVAVGPGLPDKRGNHQPMAVKAGDTIRYGNGDYLDWPIVRDGGVDYQMIREPDVVGVVELQARAA